MLSLLYTLAQISRGGGQETLVTAATGPRRQKIAKISGLYIASCIERFCVGDDLVGTAKTRTIVCVRFPIGGS